MQHQKKLTLQEYIECYNIKKKLRQRTKEKSRSKSREPHDTSLNPGTQNNKSLSVDNSKQKLRHNQKQLIDRSIYGHIDTRAKSLYHQLQQSINQIKLECRGIIRNDKDFAYFIKLMDALMQKFRQGVMHIHRQNLLLFQMSHQGDKSTEKDELGRTYLEKSFQDNWLESKNEFEINSTFLPQKTIKQNMEDNKKGEEFVKAISGGLAGQMSKGGKLAPKKYDTQATTEEQRTRRKQQAVSFLGFIMRNISQVKKSQEQQKKDEPQQQKSRSQPILPQQPQIHSKPHLTIEKPPVLLVSQPSTPQLKAPDSAMSFFTSILNMPKQPQPSTLSTNSRLEQKTPTKSQPKSSQKDPKNQLRQKKQDQRLVKNINYLNSSGKIDINTEEIDKYYDQHNMSFGVGTVREINEGKKSKEKNKDNRDKPTETKNIPKSPNRPSQPQVNDKLKQKLQQIDKISKQVKNSKQKISPLPTIKQAPKVPQTRTPNHRPNFQRTNSRSNGKPARLSAMKKAN